MTPWLAFGIAGAAAVFAVWPWPAPGMRIRNGIFAVAAVLASAGLWLGGTADAWHLGAGWYAAFTLLQLGQRHVAAGRLRLGCAGVALLMIGWGGAS